MELSDLDKILNMYKNQMNTITKSQDLKIAIEFYGHARSFRSTADSIVNNLIKTNNNPDIFIHTWNVSDHSDRTWHNPNGETRGFEMTDEDIDFIKCEYNPKKLVVEPQLVPKNNPTYIMIMTERETPYSNILNIFYTKWKANQLRLEYEKEKNVKYDYVIQARLDMFFIKPFYVRDYVFHRTQNHNPIDVFDGNEVFHSQDPYENSTVYTHKLTGGVDCFYFAKPDTMTKFVSVYENLEKIDLNERFFSNEYLIMYNAVQEGLNPVNIRFVKDKDFYLIRSDGKSSCSSIQINTNQSQVV